jgi:addiction module HigA family antidote
MVIKKKMRPSHPGSYVRNWVLPEGMTVTQAAKHLGVARQALDALLNGRSSLSPEMALRLEKAFGQPMEVLMRMQLAFETYSVREREAEITGGVEPYQAA